MLEVDGIPTHWAESCNRDGRDLGAVALGRRALRRVRRHAADPRRAARVRRRAIPPGMPGARRASRRFTFLSVFEWGERKAPEVLLRAYAAAFAGPEKNDVLLLLRANNHDGHVDVAAQIEALGLPERRPARRDPLQQPHPGEPARRRSTAARTRSSCRRAARAGECRSSRRWPAACPRSRRPGAGRRSSCTTGVGYPLAVRGLVPADAKCPYYEGFRWADPDPDDLVAKLRHVFTHREEARAKGAAAAAEAAAKWTWAHTAARIEERLREIGA